MDQLIDHVPEGARLVDWGLIGPGSRHVDGPMRVGTECKIFALCVNTYYKFCVVVEALTNQKDDSASLDKPWHVLKLEAKEFADGLDAGQTEKS